MTGRTKESSVAGDSSVRVAELNLLEGYFCFMILVSWSTLERGVKENDGFDGIRLSF